MIAVLAAHIRRVLVALGGRVVDHEIDGVAIAMDDWAVLTDGTPVVFLVWDDGTVTRNPVARWTTAPATFDQMLAGQTRRLIEHPAWVASRERSGRITTPP